MKSNYHSFYNKQETILNKSSNNTLYKVLYFYKTFYRITSGLLLNSIKLPIKVIAKLKQKVVEDFNDPGEINWERLHNFDIV